MDLDYDELRKGYEEIIPFNRFLKLEIAELAQGRGVVRLPAREELKNHVGSQHAGALFAAGEAASGGAFIGAFADRMQSITPLAEKAEIQYRRIAHGPITATGTFGEDADSLLSKLDDEGLVRFPVQVDLTDAEGSTVAEMTVHWHVRANQED
jgi:acyl-coenzyme A thioesterase PaaI-like protein